MTDKRKSDKSPAKLSDEQLALLFGPPPARKPAQKAASRPALPPPIPQKPEPLGKAGVSVKAQKPLPPPQSARAGASTPSSALAKAPSPVSAPLPKKTPSKKSAVAQEYPTVAPGKPASTPRPAPSPTKESASAKNTQHQASEQTTHVPDPIEWTQQMARLAEQAHKLMAEQATRHEPPPTPPQLPHGLLSAFADLTSHMARNPVHLLQAQADLGRRYLELWQKSWLRFLGLRPDNGQQPLVMDKRFKDPVWQDNPVFDFIKQTYLLTSHWLQDQVGQLKDLSPEERKKVDFYTRQFVDAISPTNFAMTNPQVLRATLESGGENIIKGFQNLLADLESGRIRMTDERAFEVGKNLATTPGTVVFRNDLFELIQYAPTTPQVAKTPLLIIPPWINKFYILDLKPQNSFIKWAVDQGLTVFCVSWINPDERHAKLDFEGYINKGLLVALEQAKKMAAVERVNVIGYCIGGTMLSAALASLHAKDPQLASSFASATYFTTMVDFSEPGDLGVFIDEQQVASIEAKMADKGYLDASEMATTFNLLRSNDLIWSFVVNNYLLGKEPFPFDLLYWNSDSTRMPAAMHSYYLREMYLKNRLCKPGALKMNGVAIDLRRIRTPSFILSAREDHIAPWASTYAATRLYKGPVKFVLAGSGHIAGVINPPAANKYSYWTNKNLPSQPKDWLAGASEQAGSWWPCWREWLAQYDDGQVPARLPAKGLGAAPGTYVKVRTV